MLLLELAVYRVAHLESHPKARHTRNTLGQQDTAFVALQTAAAAI